MLKIRKFFKLGTIILIAVGIAVIADVQDFGAARADPSAMPEIGAYEALSPRNKKIAEALFNGQIVTDNGKAPLSLDLIAASKQRSGWGRIFKQLKRDGLIDAKNLRDLTSGRYQRRTAVRRGKPTGSAGGTVVTTAAGRQIIVNKRSQSGQARRNRGRSMNRRGSQNSNKHTDGLFGGGTYRGRTNSGSAPSIGITSGSGAVSPNIITK